MVISPYPLRGRTRSAEVQALRVSACEACCICKGIIPHPHRENVHNHRGACGGVNLPILVPVESRRIRAALQEKTPLMIVSEALAKRTVSENALSAPFYFSDNQLDRLFLTRFKRSLEISPIAPSRISPDTTAKRPTRITLVTFNPLCLKSLEVSSITSSNPEIYWRVCEEIMQINQSSYSPGNFPNKRAGRNLPSSRSV